MQIIRVILSVSILAAAPLAIADEAAFLFAKADGCMDGPLKQFGRYIGDWSIEDESLAQDGSGWGPGNGARWIFSCLGDGTAIQDFWIPNPLRKITFFPPDENGWNWKLEFSSDEGETWTEVYRIKATPWVE